MYQHRFTYIHIYACMSVLNIGRNDEDGDELFDAFAEHVEKKKILCALNMFLKR